MSNPIILYKNRLEDSTLTATDTATGYDVNNIIDLRTHTRWLAGSAGTKYITVAALATDTLAQEEMRLSPAAGYAGVYLPADLDLTPYLGDRIVCLDSALKKHIGYIKSVGDKAVNLTYAASGSSGIVVADNDNIDFGTGNFTLVWKGSLPDWTPSGGVSTRFIEKSQDGTNRYLFYIYDSSPYLRLAIAGAVALSSASTSTLVDGTTHEVVAVVTYGAVNSTVDFYMDGVAFGTQQTVATATFSNTGALYVLGNSTSRFPGTVQHAYAFNRALTAAEVLSLYQNGIAAADQWGSQTALTSGTLTVGKKYRINTYNADDDFTNIGAASNTAGIEFVATGTTPTHWAHLSELVLLGATLALEESGIGDTDWQDSSSNNLDASYPAAGSAVVTRNTIVSTPEGTTYNWESVDGSFNYADAAGYSYLIGEPDYADTLGIMGHNLGTASAAVSVESSDDGTNWTERLAAFTPTNDFAILKTMTSFQAASKRLKIVTAATAPYIACALLGVRLEFAHGISITGGPIVPWQFGIVASSQRSKTGNLLGNIIRYKPISISVTIPTDLYTWFNAYFWPFWRDHGSDLKPFLYAPDLTTFTDKIFWLKLTPDSVLAPPMLMKDRVDGYTFEMEGVLEE